MVDVLDYSSGYPTPAAVKAAKYVGVVRYIGTPGRGKNLTQAEARAMLAAGVPIGLVYEAGAGWMLGGSLVGAGAARAALADAAACGVTVRCVYFAADFDVTNAQQMQAVEQTLDGAAGVLGRARVGVYGEADVIDACLSGGHAVWGWQTRAWSGGRLSTRAHLIQQIGYVDVGGVQCDRSTVLNDDWGQWPYTGDDISMADAATLETQIAALSKQLGDTLHLLEYGDSREDSGGHPWNLAQVRRDVAALSGAVNTQLAAANVAIAKLAALIGAADNDLTAEQVEAAVAAAIADHLVHVQVDVQAAPATDV